MRWVWYALVAVACAAVCIGFDWLVWRIGTPRSTETSVERSESTSSTTAPTTSGRRKAGEDEPSEGDGAET